MKKILNLLLFLALPATAGDSFLRIPMCFLFDSSVDPIQADANIKGLVTAYASCGITLQPYAFRIQSNYPKNFDRMLEASILSCPIPTVLGGRGAIQIESRFEELPQQMCGNPKAEGCSTLCYPLSISFVKPNATLATRLHESMHSNCCGPLCVDTEEGEGTPAGVGLEWAYLGQSEFYASTNSSDLQISPAGCRALTAGATLQESNIAPFYLSSQGDKVFDLMLKKNLFELLKLESSTDSVAKIPPVQSIQRAAEKIFQTLKKGLSQSNNVKSERPFFKLGESEVSSIPISRTPAQEPKKASSENGPKYILIDVGAPRKRGSGLRKSGDPTRKSTGSGIGVINADEDSVSSE